MKTHPILASAASAIAAVLLVVPSARAQGSNFCGAPQVITGVGTFAFDNTAATLDGPGSCANDDKNVWFHWQPPYGGIAFISTCGQTNVHTIVNVYQYTGTGCPAGGTVYCSFVGCGPGASQGYVSFGCTPALYYAIEIGSAPGFPGGAGTFTIAINTPGSTQPFCFGDGSNGPCPCGNSGGAGRGCQNSAGTGGALLTASGNPNVSADSLVLTSTGELPNALTIFLQGTTSVGPLPFGDGLRCAGGNLKRLYVKAASGGTASAPDTNDPPVSLRSAQLGDPISVGDVRYYHSYYRDNSATFCPTPTGGTFNSSNGMTVGWGNS